ncbi:DUF5082 family protein [Pseudogracilibacillus auburnensis]|uniref:Uncharacterized protein DUF5082 n=1 Tax=Pseudogracilibacillus auburnensis TaxID=1494959 RepID=A0A2V3W567_9BACI|nr:DUF5082 family protein [Pseudogracilibacillus auburnensis]PXW89447.1 uncharacterized protein DUF5082 [Pseudogracilibacillus auburnensis]
MIKISKLSLINMQIFNTEASIRELNGTLYEQRMNLDRLEKTYIDLQRSQTEFQQYKNFCTTPRLSNHTWHGRLARDFESFQESEIEVSYQSISKKQLDSILQQLKNEIQSIKQSITSIEGNISFRESKLSGLRDQRRKELMA